MKKPLVLLLCACAALALTPAPALASSALPQQAFTILDYNVNVQVSESNAYSVDETIIADFTEPKHGIFRDIPLSGGSVQDVSVEGMQYTTQESGDDFEIIIGDPEATVTGTQTYQIHYTYYPSGDSSSGFSGVYYNLIGTGWDTTIDSVEFSVTLPKPFDASMLGFSLGAAGDKGYDPAVFGFSVSGNIISGSVKRRLQPYEGLTMRLELPQGYFVPATVVKDDGPQVDAASGEGGQILPMEDGPPLLNSVGGLFVPGALIGFFVFGGVVLVIIAIAVAALLRGRAPGGTGQYGSGMQSMQEMELLRERERRMHQDFTPPPPPPPPPDGGGFTGGGSAGGGGGSW